jgi:pimeloyl-ACP methyl ester carboxylesterase
MHVMVNGVRLFFDVTGEKLVPDGLRMHERPTVLLLHGGPGFDHSMFKPAFEPLADIAQVVMLDHRGNGRSDHGDPARWTLEQWADDVMAFCQNTCDREAYRARLLFWWHRCAVLRDSAPRPSGEADPL